MKTNPLFRDTKVSEKTRVEFNISFVVADRIDAILKKKGMTQIDLANKMGKSE